MQLTRSLAAAALGTTALAALASPAVAAPPNTVEVGTCRPGLTSYPTITAALNSAPAGYTIDVCPGTYPEQLSITQNVTITGLNTGGRTGNGASQARLVVPAGGFQVNATDLDNGQPTVAQIVVSNASSVTLNNLTIDGSGADFSQSGCADDFVGVLFQNASGTLSNSAVLNTNLNDPNLFGCQDGLGVFAQANSGSSIVTFSGNYVDGFQKNGITADDQFVVASITGNTVLGIGATNLIAQNSIQIGFGAKGTVSGNAAGDDVYTPMPDSAGVLIYDSTPSSATDNVVTNADYAIAVYADAAGAADKPRVSDNQIETAFDAIDICGSANGTVSGNLTDGVANGAVHVDASCNLTTSLSNASGNRFNNACAGLLEGNGTTVQSVSGNTYLSVAVDVASGMDSCSTGDARPDARRPHVAAFR